MFSLRTRYFLNLISAFKNTQPSINTINKIQAVRITSVALSNCQQAMVVCPNLEISKRYKHKDSKKSKKGVQAVESDDEENEETEEDDWDKELTDKQTKLITLRVNSLRADLILKAGMGIARNKIENMFYESKIRVNGQKLLKKASFLSVGDEVDIVRGPSIMNSDFLTVSRIEILSATEKGEGLSVRVRRNKALTIENYQQDPHKS